MTVATIRLLVLVLMACIAQVVFCSSLSGNETDRLSLLEFKKAISLDPQQVLESWNSSIHFCNWEGVLCRVKTPNRVISLDLASRGLVGKISSSLGNMTFLKSLVLARNAFTGVIPPSLGHLHRLQILNFSYNILQGGIPDFANCTNLKVLQLDRNNLVGKFPNLPPQLQELMLNLNNLSGTIPPSLANITTLSRIRCAFNNIEGNIPSEFAKLPNLLSLSVNTNKLAGTFQPAILNVSTLLTLDLGGNYLTGEVPSNLGNSLPNLQRLILSANFFHGHIPHSLTNATNLSLIDMSQNNFTRVLPSSIGRLTKLQALNLQLNQFQASNKQDWEFMNSLSNCTDLQMLSLARNQLEGHLPSTLSNLSAQLQYLFLGQNQLSGDFPSGIANFPNLIILGLDHNQFTGIVPDWLGTIQNLQGMSLLNNKFTGFIPSTLSNLSQLGALFLGLNKFDGEIHPSLGNLQMLEILSIPNNSLQGSIPEEIFKIPTIRTIELSFNNLDGQLSTDIGNAKQLIYLQLSSNKLSGDIPNTLGNCESLEYIKLDLNIFSGDIPTSLGNIRSLKVLNLSHNTLTGLVPASLGNLQLLEQLDLSFNHLKGEAPTKGIFKNATTMRVDGNKGLCGGAKELNLSACSIMPSNSSKHKLPTVGKVLIVIASMVALAMIMFILFLWRGKQNGKHKLPTVGKVLIVIASMVALAMIMFILFLWRGKQNGKSIPLPSFGMKFPKISYGDLARATEGFSASYLIGRGRYSSVYQGRLFQGGEVVAMKVFSLETRGAQRSFIAECNALRNVRHRNLVPILTACSSVDSKGNDFKALVYEFMPRGDLYKLLHSNRENESSSNLNYISLAQRLSIVVDVSEAMAYLHHNHHGSIVHCDLKPSNILLDDNMIAHVGDFGLARLQIHPTPSSSVDSISTSSIAIEGTVGYVAPECAGGGQVSTAADVYSFGVVLLEIFIRKRPTDDMFKDGLCIANFAGINLPDKVLQIVDPQLLQELALCQETPMDVEENGVHCLLSILNVGLCCTKSSPSERISMQEVAGKLHGIKDAYLVQKTK